jgi:GTPase SAR1 family protein
MNFKKFIALICAFAFVFSNLINVSAGDIAEAVFLGDSGVGKSAVFRRLVPPKRDDGVHGTTIKKLAHIKFGNNNSLCLLDASCKEMYCSEIMTLCRDADIAVICVDSTSRDSIENTDVYVEYVYDNCTNPESVTFFWLQLKQMLKVRAVIWNALGRKRENWAWYHAS